MQPFIPESQGVTDSHHQELELQTSSATKLEIPLVTPSAQVKAHPALCGYLHSGDSQGSNTVQRGIRKTRVYKK